MIKFSNMSYRNFILTITEFLLNKIHMVKLIQTHYLFQVIVFNVLHKNHICVTDLLYEL